LPFWKRNVKECEDELIFINKIFVKCQIIFLQVFTVIQLKTVEKGENMAISGISNNVSFRGGGLQKVQRAAGKAFDSAITDGKAMKYIDKAFANEGKISRFPSIFANTVLCGIVGAKDFIVNFAKNLVK